MAASLYIKFFFLLICFFTMSASGNIIFTQKKHTAPSLQKVLQALRSLDEECRPKEGWNRNSTQRGKLSCRVDGETMASDMEIITGSLQRAVIIFNFQRLTCENPVCSLDQKNRRLLRWFAVSSEGAPDIRQMSLSHITASGRFSNLVYGVGRQIERYIRILRFDLAKNSKVSEHVLRAKQLLVYKPPYIPCGLTTGKCHSKHRPDDVCIYYCFCARNALIYGAKGHLCIFAVFEEPDPIIGDIDVNIEFLSVKGVLKVGRIMSAAVDGTGKMYMIVHNKIRRSTKMVVGVSDFRNNVNIIKLFKLSSDAFMYFDINKDGVHLIANKKEMRFVVIGQDLIVYDNNWLLSKNATLRKIYLERRDCLACWVPNGNGLIFICRERPFERWTQRVKLFK